MAAYTRREDITVPCTSRITTTLTDAEHLEAALMELGYTVERSENDNAIRGYRSGKNITFDRGYGGQYTVARGTQGLTEIMMEYSKIGVKNWAKSRGYAIQSFDEKNNQFTLVNRRV